MKHLISLLALGCGLLAWMPARGRAGTVIVKEGRSNYTIVVPKDAPRSVQAAAEELQMDIALATGAKLPVATDEAKTNGGIISLGSTRQAQAAGLNGAEIAPAGFRIVTRSGNLYILGQDTPDGQWTTRGGTSDGTANGVYTFLEEKLGVRWLMPGELGRDVPRAQGLELEETDRTHVPAFSFRHVSHLSDGQGAAQRRAIATWMDRQRLGSEWNLQYNHNMLRGLTDGRSLNMRSPEFQQLYKEHPEWFAMDAKGNRPMPTRVFSKLETTNPQLVAYFAQRAIETLKGSKRPGMFSLSPSDGRGWSQSPQSKALYDPSPSTLFDPEAPAGLPGMSSLVLKWYHDIAQIVAREYPQGRLGGYIYADYVYPPTKFTMKLPDNFTPVICGIGEYGYGLYRKDNQERYNYVMDAWAKVAPKNWFYYGLPNQMLRQFEPEIGAANFPGSTAVVTPAAPEILNFVWDNFRRNRMKGANLYGVPSWSNAAMANYMLAQMMWNPKLDAYEVQKDWLNRAYGPEAGGDMLAFYQKLDGWFGDYYRSHAGLSYKLTSGMLKDIYAAHYGDLEALYLRAESRKKTEAQGRRLALIGDNLSVLQWRLRNGGFWPAGLTSRLRKDDKAVIALLETSTDGFDLFPGIVSGRLSNDNRMAVRRAVEAMEEVKVKLVEAPAPAEAGEMPPLDENVFVLYASQDGPVRIVPKLVVHGAYFATYVIAENYGAVFSDGPGVVASGVLSADAPITFNTRANQAYYLYLPPRKPVRYQLNIENAAVAEAGFKNGTMTLYGNSAPVHIYYQLGDAPIGIFEHARTVTLQRPFSAASAKAGLVKRGRYEDVQIVTSLDEGWRFSPDPKDELLKRGVTGDQFDDSAWKTISALNWWQTQGFADYHGPAWYRIQFKADALKPEHTALFYFGAIDGNAQVYLNGEKIKEHTLGPDFAGWNKAFFAMSRHLKAGTNTLAVRVVSKNDRTNSGIFKGVSLLTGKRK